MRINQELDLSSYGIRSFNSGEITVIAPRIHGGESQEQHLSESFVIMPKQLIPNWPLKSVSELTEVQLHSLIQYAPELVLLGTGAKLIFPEPKLLTTFTTKGIGIEVMDTAAACRTYNILMHEGRNIAAVMIL